MVPPPTSVIEEEEQSPKDKEIILVRILKILELDDDAVEDIMGTLKYNTISKIERMPFTTLKALRKEGTLHDGDVQQILHLKEWLAIHRSRNWNTLPYTVQEWEEAFTAYKFQQAINASGSRPEPEKAKTESPKDSDDDSTVESATIKSDTSGSNKSKGLYVKISDFPSFDGKQENWFSFKEQHEACSDIAKMTATLRVTDKDLHLQQRAEDPEYDALVHSMYSILILKTSKGSAITRVKMHEKTKDGALAWKDLETYYNQEGNKLVYAQTTLTQLINLTMHANTYGGLEAYTNQFLKLCTLITEADPTLLTEPMQKTFYLAGIKDSDYESAKDLCAEDTWSETLARMRKKGTQLNKLHGPERRIKSTQLQKQLVPTQNQTKTVSPKKKRIFSKKPKDASKTRQLNAYRQSRKEEGNINPDVNGDSPTSSTAVAKTRANNTEIVNTPADTNKKTEGIPDPTWNKMSPPMQQTWKKSRTPKANKYDSQYGQQKESENQAVDSKAKKPVETPDKESTEKATNLSKTSQAGNIWRPTRKQQLRITKRKNRREALKRRETHEWVPIKNTKDGLGTVTIYSQYCVPHGGGPAMDISYENMRSVNKERSTILSKPKHRVISCLPHAYAAFRRANNLGIRISDWTLAPDIVANKPHKRQCNMNTSAERRYKKGLNFYETSIWRYPYLDIGYPYFEDPQHGPMMMIHMQNYEYVNKDSSIWMHHVGHLIGPYEYTSTPDNPVEHLITAAFGYPKSLSGWHQFSMTFEDAKRYIPHHLANEILHDGTEGFRFPLNSQVYKWAFEWYMANEPGTRNGKFPRPEYDNKDRQMNTRTRSKTMPVTRNVRNQASRTIFAMIDNGSDTFGISGNAWVIDAMTDREADISGYDEDTTSRTGVPIGAGTTCTTLPTGESVLLHVYEATIGGHNAKNLFSVAQMRNAGVIVNDKPRLHGGKPYIECNDYIIPLVMKEGIIGFEIRKPTQYELDNLPVIELTQENEWNPEDQNDSSDIWSAEEYDTLLTEVDREKSERSMNFRKTQKVIPDPKEYEPYFCYPGKDAMQHTLQNTTRYGSINMRIPMRQHFHARNPLLRRKRINEPYATDTWFSSVTSFEGYNCAQIFYGINSKRISNYGMKTESHGPDALLEFFRKEGVPLSILRDNSKMQASELWKDYMRRYWVKDQFTEPYHPHQNPSERAMSFYKEKLQRLMIDTDTDPRGWFKACCHIADVHSHTAQESLQWRTPIEKQTGNTPDISGLCQFRWNELVYYQIHDPKFPTQGGNEKLGRWYGRAEDHGDTMCYWILNPETDQLVVRSMVRSAENTKRPNEHLNNKAKKLDLEASPDMGSCPVFRNIGETKNSSEYIGNKDTQEFAGPPNIYEKSKEYLATIDPEDLINLYIVDTFKTRAGRERQMKGQVTERMGSQTYRVAFDDGKQRTYEFDELINLINHEDEEGVERWTFEKILKHRTSKDPQRKGRLDVLIKWQGYEDPSWEPIEVIKKDDPVSLAKYAEDNDLIDKSAWKWTRNYLKNKKKFQRMYRQMNLAKSRRKTIKYQFGVRVPRNLAEARKLDELNKDSKWHEAIQLEITKLMDEHSCFNVLQKDQRAPQGYSRIPLIWTFAVKFDGRHRARCVAGGHVTPDPEDSLYSGVVDLETVRIAFTLSTLMELDVLAADIGSAYIQANTIEKVYTIAGPEFGPLEGRVLLVVRALYGLKTSGAMWHQKLAQNLRDLGFSPCPASYDLWLRDMGDHYEYIAVIVDDLLVFSRDPTRILETLKSNCGYKMSGVGVPEYYSGADVEFDDVAKCWSISAKTYIRSVVDRIEKLLDTTFKNYGSPMEAGDHPEMDTTDFIYAQDISIYQMLIGCAQWAVTLGRFDIQYATNTLARFASAPREGHLNRCKRLFGYLKYNDKAKLRMDPSDPNYEDLNFKENQDWKDLYPDAEEYMPDKMPRPVNKRPLHITVILDASHGSCYVTRRSVTGYMLFIGQAPIRWYSKRQNTVESSTYGSELVAMRIAVEALLDMRYKLRMMGIKIHHTSTLLCDNESVIINTQLPTSTLKKKHNSVAYHKCREVVAARIVRTTHVRSENNVANHLTKAAPPQEYYRFLHNGLLFGTFENW
jgi:hypothetical protein